MSLKMVGDERRKRSQIHGGGAVALKKETVPKGILQLYTTEGNVIPLCCMVYSSYPLRSNRIPQHPAKWRSRFQT